jgi:hypothetical protein
LHYLVDDLAIRAAARQAQGEPAHVAVKEHSKRHRITLGDHAEQLLIGHLFVSALVHSPIVDVGAAIGSRFVDFLDCGPHGPWVTAPEMIG